MAEETTSVLNSAIRAAAAGVTWVEDTSASRADPRNLRYDTGGKIHTWLFEKKEYH